MKVCSAESMAGSFLSAMSSMSKLVNFTPSLCVLVLLVFSEQKRTPFCDSIKLTADTRAICSAIRGFSCRSKHVFLKPIIFVNARFVGATGRRRQLVHECRRREGAGLPRQPCKGRGEAEATFAISGECFTSPRRLRSGERGSSRNDRFCEQPALAFKRDDL